MILFDSSIKRTFVGTLYLFNDIIDKNLYTTYSSLMSCLKILHITSRADTGGGPKHVYDLTRTIKKNHPEIEIYIASPNEAPFAEKYREIAKEWIEVPSRGFNLKALFELRSFCKKNNISIIHSHGRGAGYFSRILKILLRVRVIHTFHGVHSLPGLASKLKLLIDRLLAPLTDQFICVSEDEKSKAISLKVGREKQIEVIMNGVDIDQIRSEYQQATRHTTTYTIGTLARFDYVKGIDILLEFFHRYFKENPDSDWQVLVAGDGPEFEKLDKMRKELGLEKWVKFIGRTDKPIEFLKQLDLYVSFSRMEGMPLSVLEAMACGVTCLLSRVE